MQYLGPMTASPSGWTVVSVAGKYNDVWLVVRTHDRKVLHQNPSVIGASEWAQQHLTGKCGCHPPLGHSTA